MQKKNVMTTWFLIFIAMLTLALQGCSGGGGSVAPDKSGYKLEINGNIEMPKSTAKTVGAAVAPTNTVSVYDAATGSKIGGPVDCSSGKFTGLDFTLANSKNTVVYVADVAGGPLRYILPLDLSNPPAGLTNNALTIEIGQNSTNKAVAVEGELGIAPPAYLGDGTTKTTADFATISALVVKYAGQVLSFSSTGLKLNGAVSNSSLLPARNVSTFSVTDLDNVALDGKVISAFIPAKNPIVNFVVTDKATGKGITGLKTFGLHVAKLVPEAQGTSSYWVNYIDKGIAVPAGSGTGATAATKPSADPGNTFNADGSVKVNGYKVIDHGDGTYTAIFASDITSNANAVYDATATHRIGITVRSIAIPGVTATGPTNPLTGAVNTNFSVPNAVAMAYDFTPATGVMLKDANGAQKFERDIVSLDACNNCHYKLGDLSGHFAARPNTKLCVMCHTSKNTSGEGEFVTFIHRIHMGEKLNDTTASNGSFKPVAKGLVTYGEQTYPQDIRNCTVCHTGGADSANWKTKPTRKNCGSCHNALDFSTHQGGQTDDSFCAGCHVGATAIKDIIAVHTTNDPTANNPNTPAGLSNFVYSISSVSLNASGQPVITFQIKKDGTAVTFNTYAAGAVPVTGFSGGPTLYVVYSVPQDGITAPADFNARSSVSLTNIWNGTQGTLAGPDASGNYTATLTGTAAAPIKVPASAKMLTGAVIGNFTQTTVTPNVVRDSLAVQKVATGYSARRTIVETARCNKCHEQLGISPSFHSGARNDATLCAFCHTVNQTSSGWSANASTFVHGIHSAKKRSVPFTWHAVSATDTYAKVTYPGFLRNCEQCHLAGSYDFSSAAATAALPNLLWTTVAKGKYDGASATAYTLSPYIIKDNLYDYGLGYSYTPATDVTVEAASTTLVSSPIAAACFSCHDTPVAKAHIEINGGAIYAARSSVMSNGVFNKTETCLVCHGTAANTQNTTIQTIKGVHRWW